MSMFANNLRIAAIIIAMTFLIPLTAFHGAKLLSGPPARPPHPGYEMGQRAPKAEKGPTAKAEPGKDHKKDKKADKKKPKKRSGTMEHQVRAVFYTCVLAGILCVVLGLLLELGFINTGLILGGSMSIIRGYHAYWPLLSDLSQFVSLVIALIAVMTISPSSIDR